MLGKEILHLCGPFSINTYGVFIALGLFIFSWLANSNPRRAALLSEHQFGTAILLGIVAGLLGGRTLYFISNWQMISCPLDLIALWQGGFSVLGSFISIIAILWIYLRRQQIPVLPFFDLVALYAPLLQAISRFGCFFAGCCFGATTSLPWAVQYVTENTLAPRNLLLHPTQLYSAGLLFIIFCTVHILSRYNPRPGILITTYVTLASAERFIVDFFRADREFIAGITLLSLHQITALAIALCSTVCMITFLYKRPTL